MNGNKTAREHAIDGEVYRSQGIDAHVGYATVAFVDSIRAFNKAIRMKNNYAWAWAHLGEARIGATDLKMTVVDSELDLEDKVGEAYTYEDAVKAFERATSLDSDYAWAWAHLGETYRLMAFKNIYELNFDKCEEYFKKGLDAFNTAIELDRDYTWAYAHRAAIYRWLEPAHTSISDSKGLQDFNRAIELHPYYAWAYGYRNVLYRMRNKWHQAYLDAHYAEILHPGMITLEELMFGKENPGGSEKLREIMRNPPMDVDLTTLEGRLHWYLYTVSQGLSNGFLHEDTQQAIDNARKLAGIV